MPLNVSMAVAALLCAGVAVAADPASAPFAWPNPNLIEAIDVPETLVANGVPVRIKSIHVKRRADEMLQVYATAFEKAGFYIDYKQQQYTSDVHLTALDWRRKISYTVLLQPLPDGTTACVLGEANVGALKQTTGDDFAPLMPGASAAVRINQEYGKILTYSVASRLEEVERFYAEVLPKAGYAASPEPTEKNLFRKGNERVQLQLEQIGPTTSVVLIHRRTAD